MREYKALGGNALFLDSKKIIARTQFVEEECEMSKIRDAMYEAPNFRKNGCLTIVTDNNIMPIYFVSKQSDDMIEAFSIINALARKKEGETGVVTGRHGSSAGKLKCVKAGHPILRHTGKMTVYLLPNCLRFEYSFVNQGCSVPFEDILSITSLFYGQHYALLTLSEDKKKEPVLDLSVFDEKGLGKNSLYNLNIEFNYKGKSSTLAFEGKTCASVAKKMLDAYASFLEAAQKPLPQLQG